jgi:hypothetical protein
VNLTFVEHVKQEKEKVKRKAKDTGLSPEESERIQAELFAQSKARMEQGSAPVSALPE